MNNLIKELAHQCGFRYDEGSWVFAEDAHLQEFAELIVRECEKVAKDPKWYGENPSNCWRNPIRHVCNEMKEHFGVEE